MSRQYAPIICEDGFRMSVQACSRKYCTPRNDEGPYHEVEIGFPSNMEPLLIRYAEDKANPTNTVYGWVPTRVLWEVITKHGGIKSGNLPPTIMSS